MRIVLRERNAEHVVERDAPAPLASILEEVGIPPSTVLTVVDGTIVPHTAMVSDDLEVELVIVSSGG